MKLSVINTFLFFLVLASSPFNISSNTTTPHHKQTLTDAVIHDLCNPTLNLHLYTCILHKYKGIPLSPKPLLNLVSNLQIQVAHTKKNILFTKNQAVKPNHPKFITKCWDGYTHAMTQIKEATKSIAHDRIGDVKNFMLTAMVNVNSCDVELAKAKRDHSTIGNDNKKFKDICSVVLVMCDKLLHPVHDEE